MIQKTEYRPITAPNQLITTASFGNTYISVVLGDITKEPVAAIVNAANIALTPGGGVSGSIFKAAGDLPFEECRTIHPEGVEVGIAFRTGPGKLLKKGLSGIIHVPGPDCSIPAQAKMKAQLLKKAYWNTLEVARMAGDRTLTIPAISTAHFGYKPVKEATLIACETVKEFLHHHKDAFDEVRLIFHDRGEDLDTAKNFVDELAHSSGRRG